MVTRSCVKMRPEGLNQPAGHWNIRLLDFDASEGVQE